MERKPLFKVEKMGLQTSFQDLGRYGYQKFGVPVSGAMDPFSLQVANLLVGNPRGEAGIEMTMMGPALVAESKMVAAICGGDLSPKVNGEPVALWKSFYLEKGDHLTFGQPKSGLRSYLAVSGGFDISAVMGSKSCFAKAGLGEEIQEGDTICGFESEGSHGIGLNPAEIPEYGKEIEVRIVKGPHADHFTEEGRHTFFNETHKVSPQSDRMGYRLESEAIKRCNREEVWTDAIPFGGIQIPASGQPILLMADRQTTGGYPRIGTVISVDLPKVAQLTPGGKIHFREVSVDEAENLYRKQEHFFKMTEIRGESDDFTS